MSLLRNLKQRAKQLKLEAQVLMIACKDKRLPISAMLMAGLTVGYLLSPIDLIPDFIPVLGILDDLIIVPALIALSIKLIPRHILSDARETLRTNPQRLKKTNWIFATIIIVIWAIVVFYTYVLIKKLFWVR